MSFPCIHVIHTLTLQHRIQENESLSLRPHDGCLLYTSDVYKRQPIEQTSEEKRQVYEERYTQYISANPRCLGSFVFLWGQKEERPPTWFLSLIHI